MHRAYQPITPANNKLLKKRWDTARFLCHRKKVDDASSVIDNKPPKTYMHLHLKLKNLQVEEERLAEVEKDNRILLEKMSYIMRTRGSVDNRNDYQQKSLNKTKRQRELLRLTHENQAILKRINSKGPHYKHLDWEDDWKTKQKYMDNISRYPKDWHRRSKPDLQPILPGSGSKSRRSTIDSIKKRNSTKSNSGVDLKTIEEKSKKDKAEAEGESSGVTESKTKSGDEALSNAESKATDGAENKASAENEATDNAENKASAENEASDNAENKASAENEVTGDAENKASAENDVTGDAENEASAEKDATGVAQNEAPTQQETVKEDGAKENEGENNDENEAANENQESIHQQQTVNTE